MDSSFSSFSLCIILFYPSSLVTMSTKEKVGFILHDFVLFQQ